VSQGPLPADARHYTELLDQLTLNRLTSGVAFGTHYFQYIRARLENDTITPDEAVSYLVQVANWNIIDRTTSWPVFAPVVTQFMTWLMEQWLDQTESVRSHQPSPDLLSLTSSGVRQLLPELV